MTKRLLIDASHAEETRVVVLDGNRLEDFDVETQSRRQLKGNIYLAKVVRVEPSLQAAFVEYGGNRHGFLAFGEIHPDYYQIPVADRQRLLAMQEEEARAEEDDEDASDVANTAEAPPQAAPADEAEPTAASPAPQEPAEADGAPATLPVPRMDPQALPIAAETLHAEAEPLGDEPSSDAPPAELPANAPLGADTAPEMAEPASPSAPDPLPDEAGSASPQDEGGEPPAIGNRVHQIAHTEPQAPEILGGENDTGEEARPARSPSRFMRSYKIQEVIRRRQILLVQVVKEERGTKGAALTTYISLAGRYCVLMPNSPRGGGISRKITSAMDRKRLKEVTAELDLPRGMGLIVRTAGAARPKPEIKRDGEYLLRLWDDIRERTLQSMAPSLIHEEASLIKRAIRDIYSRDVDQLLVDGEDGWRAARDYMRMLMPTHVKKVQLWPQNAQPLFAHQQVESLLDAMLSPTVQLRSGGYLVINQTEALVAIDVNSGRSTRERGIEETALRTNLEAADEAARQLRLRDLAGLIVIDFIDMESNKHNAMVERRMAEALKNDRARIQIGRISHFGLLELSRQRLRPSLAETSLNLCVHCGGTGYVRSTESAALHVLREIEEEGGRRRAAEILVHVASETALYILNNKRQRLTEIEQRYNMIVCFASDESLLPAQTRIDRVRAALPAELPPPVIQPVVEDVAEDEAETTEEDDVVMPAAAAAASDDAADPDHVPGETEEEGERRRRRRRRRRRGSRREDGVAADGAAPIPDGMEQPEIPDLDLPIRDDEVPMADPPAAAVPAAARDDAEAAEALAEPAPPSAGVQTQMETEPADAEPAPAKRGRRGGRRRRKPGEDAAVAMEPESPHPAPAYPAYVGPTPADPFALPGLDIFEALEQIEQSPAPVATATVVVAEAPPPPPADTDQAPPSAAADQAPAAGPLVKPVIIGSSEAAVLERKRGWWRR
jgi:ribonuclease E